MSKTQTYRQCELRQHTDETSYRRYVAWLPSETVRINRRVTIDGLDGVWVIESAGDPKDARLVEAYARHAREWFDKEY